jgi:hypothetical protein
MNHLQLELSQLLSNMRSGIPFKCSPEMEALAEKAVQRCGLPEDIEEWASKLAKDLSKFTD